MTPGQARRKRRNRLHSWQFKTGTNVTPRGPRSKKQRKKSWRREA